ncbi:MAG: response regulator [Lachnospiraceae bacterium]|nr:response regulator [Lachnospiraceae bacterium]
MNTQEKSNLQQKETKIPFKEVIQGYGLRKAIVFPIIAVLFIAIVLTYHMLLLTYTRQSILEAGEINAADTVEEIDLYFSSARYTLERSVYAVHQMIHSNASKDMILDYLVDETDTVIGSILPNTTGIYGYVNGEYVDGSLWEPDADYDPVERPWYTEAMAADGDIVLVNPYLDLYSGSIVMTLSQSIPQHDCVIAVDVTLERIQEIIEESTQKYVNSINFIVSRDGFVVAHSDSAQIGRNYLEEKDSMYGNIMEYLSSTSDDSFDVTYDGRSYTVYAASLGSGWYSVSIVDSETIYKPLRRMMLLSIFAVILTLIVFTLIMIYSGKREARANHLRSLLTSSADIYMLLIELDLVNNDANVIKSATPAVAEAIKVMDHNMDEIFAGIMHRLPESPTKQNAIDFTDLSTIQERMKDTDTITTEYMSYGNIWVRARFIVSKREANGRITGLLWMLENISLERQERDNLIGMTERAVTANEAKTAFLSSMSHEIRTPINAVLGMNEMILRESNDPQILSYSRNIKNSGDTLLGIVNDILDLSRIESGKMEIIANDYDFTSLLDALIAMIRPQAENKGLKFEIDIDPEIPRSLYGDELKLKQIITNILTNAVKYTPEGSVRMIATYDKDIKINDCVVLSVSVADTGIGIKPENIQRIFTEFERFDQKKNRGIQGTGLGMAITNNLLKMMGGTIEIKSDYGKGSQFTIKLVQTVRKWDPIGEYKLESDENLTEKKYVPKFKASGARVLAVDDMAVNLVVFRGLLAKTEIGIDTADNGDDAVRLAAENKYDIIFLDHMMPGKDGVETLREMNADPGNINRETPVICLTANAVAGAREYYMECGFDGYLTKPIDSEELEQMIYDRLPKDKIETEG